jgi:hypothetical protein
MVRSRGRDLRTTVPVNPGFINQELQYKVYTYCCALRDGLRSPACAFSAALRISKA